MILNDSSSQQNSQVQNKLNPDQSRAALGVATALLQHNLPQGYNQSDDQNQAQTQETAPQQEQTAKPDEQAQLKEDIGAKMTEFELSITKQIQEFRKEMKESQKQEMDSIRNEIKAALIEEDNEEKE